MTTHCRKTERNNQCGVVEIGNQQRQVCTPFSVCLPFGRSLAFNGECITLEGAPSIPDGEYGIIVVENGCIVDARPNPVFDYTPPPCTPSVPPCGDGESGGVVLQPGICNLLSLDATGRLGAFLSYEAGDGVTITGCGTTSSPLVISAQTGGGDKTYIISGTLDILPLEGEGTIDNPYVISHATTAIGPGVYAGFTLDAYGHIIAYTNPEAGAIASIIAGPGVAVEQQGAVATIGLTASPQEPGTWLLGGWALSTDLSGRVVGIERQIATVAGTYDPMYNEIDVNEFGSITSIRPTTRTVDTAFSTFFDGERDITSTQITIRTQGHFRITYRGDLGPATAPTPEVGLVPLPAPYRVRVNNLVTPAYARITDGRITEVHCLAQPLYAAGTYTISISGPAATETTQPFSDTGMLDIVLVELGE